MVARGGKAALESYTETKSLRACPVEFGYDEEHILEISGTSRSMARPTGWMRTCLGIPKGMLPSWIRENHWKGAQPETALGLSR